MAATSIDSLTEAQAKRLLEEFIVRKIDKERVPVIDYGGDTIMLCRLHSGQPNIASAIYPALDNEWFTATSYVEAIRKLVAAKEFFIPHAKSWPHAKCPHCLEELLIMLDIEA